MTKLLLMRQMVHERISCLTGPGDSVMGRVDGGHKQKNMIRFRLSRTQTALPYMICTETAERCMEIMVFSLYV